MDVKFFLRLGNNGEAIDFDKLSLTVWKKVSDGDSHSSQVKSLTGRELEYLLEYIASHQMFSTASSPSDR
jgi:hypothetical protein